MQIIKLNQNRQQNFKGIRLVEGPPCQIMQIAEKLLENIPDRINAANISPFDGIIKHGEDDIAIISTGSSPEWKVMDEVKAFLVRNNIRGKKRVKILQEKLSPYLDFSKPPQKTEEMLAEMDHADYDYLALNRNKSQNLN